MGGLLAGLGDEGSDLREGGREGRRKGRRKGGGIRQEDMYLIPLTMQFTTVGGGNSIFIPAVVKTSC